MDHLHPRPVAIVFDMESGGPVLVISGSLVGASLHKLAVAMDGVLHSHGDRFVIDLREVDDWSLMAQAMLLMTARRKAALGEELVLRGASPVLQEQSRRLGLFERVRSIDSPRNTASWDAGVPDGTETRAVRLVGGDS